MKILPVENEVGESMVNLVSEADVPDGQFSLHGLPDSTDTTPRHDRRWLEEHGHGYQMRPGVHQASRNRPNRIQWLTTLA